MTRRNVVIIGAVGRDFHSFNTRHRDDKSVSVMAFTTAEIPGIEDRRYHVSPRHGCGRDRADLGDIEQVRANIAAVNQDARAHYDLQEIGNPDLNTVLKGFVRERNLG